MELCGMAVGVNSIVQFRVHLIGAMRGDRRGSLHVLLHSFFALLIDSVF